MIVKRIDGIHLNDNDRQAVLAAAKILREAFPVDRVVLAKCEYEAWYLAAAVSLQGHRGLPQNFAPPPEPERIRGAKERLASQMRGNYSEVTDQPALTALLDLRAA